MTSANQKVRDCVNATLEHMNDEIIFDSEKDEFKDFLEPKKENIYDFKSIPNKDFRMEATASDIALNDMQNDTGIKIILSGVKGNAKTVLHTFDMIVDNDKTSIDFNVVFKKVTESYDRLQMQLDVTNQNLFFRGRFVSADVQEV